ncbi:hypothetical protein ACFQX6_55965 [Streptosporangium lutulentum]
MIGTGRDDDRDIALSLGAQTFLDLDADDLRHVGEVDVVFARHRRTPGKTIIQVADEQGAQRS